MSGISSLYSSNQTVYRKKGKRSSKGKHGDVKHIVFKEGVPVYTEIIRVQRQEEEEKPKTGSKPKRIRASNNDSSERKSSEAVLQRKKTKLNERLKNAIKRSQTLWSEKEKIWISYQGSQGFLVKRFDETDRMISSDIMTQSQLLEGTIPGLLDTGWKVV